MAVARRWRNFPMNFTVSLADLSSKQGTTVVGAGSLLSLKIGSMNCWRIYLSDKFGIYSLSSETLRTLCPYPAPSNPA